MTNKASISGSFTITATNSPSYTIADTSAIRVKFIKDSSSVTPFVSAKFCIITAEEVKIFVGIFLRDDGTESTFIQIPLLGQSVSDLIDSINTYSDVLAESVNSGGYISTLLLKDTRLVESGGNWLYFEASEISINMTYSTLPIDIKFYLTTPEPLSVQKNLTQSLGGYVSSSEVYRSALLSSSASIYDTTIYIDPTSISESFTLTDIQSSKYLQINDEIVKINSWNGYAAYLSERNSFGTPLRFHPKNSVVREINKNDFFDSFFSDGGKQYRCIAIKNTNSNDIAKDLKVFFEFPSRNNLSNTRIAIEVPKSDIYSGVVTSGGITAFSSYGLINKFSENHFALSPILFNSGNNAGQSRIVKSYNPTSGTIILDNRLPNDIIPGNLFTIDTSPAQIIKSGMKTPLSPPASAFFDAVTKENAISINVSGSRVNGADLYPNDVIYIWIERSISESNDEFMNNRAILSLIYSRV